MKMHTFGNSENPIMLLIHGVLTPWQIWSSQIEAFKENYYVHAAALNAHTEEEPSEFISLEDEACAIENYFLERDITTVGVVCGLSLGGAIAYEIWKNGIVGIDALVLDGAPLVKSPKIAEMLMTGSYLSIIHKSKQRDKKTLENFKKQFLPEKYLESYLRIADNMSDSSMRNLIRAASSEKLCAHLDNFSRILFIHGTKGNEVLSKKSAELVKKMYGGVTVKCYNGDTHCYKAIYEPDVWIRDVQNFLANNNESVIKYENTLHLGK